MVFWFQVFLSYIYALICSMANTTSQMLRSSWKHILSLIWIVSFLLFFWNLLVLLSYNTDVFNQEVKEKLWVYLYLDDSSATKDLVYSEAIDMKQELEEYGMNVEYYSKDDAFQILEERLPDVIDNFEKYGIDNPLPPTMYVLFDDEREYRVLKDIVLKYEEIIVNLEELESNWFTFSEQERRSSQVINLTNFLKKFTNFLIFIIALIIIAVLLFWLRLTFYRFLKQIEVEKLLWAHFSTIQRPFLIMAFLVMTLWFLLMIAYFIGVFRFLDWYFISVFQTSVYEYTMWAKRIWAFLLQEYLVLLVLSFFFTILYLSWLLKKI